jgi:hypothetical protein
MLAKRDSTHDVEPLKLGLSHNVEPAKPVLNHAVDRTTLPSCSLTINMDDSVAIRKLLLRDALVLIQNAGWIGTGLDSFMKLSCIKQTEVHNSILQAAVEFGWLGAFLLLLLIVSAGASILVPAMGDGASRFVLCSLSFVVLMSFAHGRISRDAVLFAFLGCAVGLKERSKRLGPAYRGTESAAATESHGRARSPRTHHRRQCWGTQTKSENQTYVLEHSARGMRLIVRCLCCSPVPPSPSGAGGRRRRHCRQIISERNDSRLNVYTDCRAHCPTIVAAKPSRQTGS